MNPERHAELIPDGVAQVAFASHNAVHLFHIEAVAGQRARRITRFAEENLEVCVQSATNNVVVVGALVLLIRAPPVGVLTLVDAAVDVLI